ncbi:MAG: hypothetical protein ABIQ39_12035 [Ilumatobacteraceae bacterium]
MDLLTTTDLKALTGADQRGPAVSIFMPTSRVSANAQIDPLRWKNMLTAVASSLDEEMVDKDTLEALLAPARELHADLWAWRHMSDGLAMFIRPGWNRIYRVPIDLPQLVAIGDRFLVSPLLGAISSEDHFLLLAVSQRDVRLLEGTRHRVEAIELPDVPVSLRDVVEAPDPRSDTMTYSLGGGRSGRAVFHGHGAADDEFKNEEVVRFLRQVGDGLQPYLADQARPVVLVGLDRNVAMFREVNTYANVLERAVISDPDDLSAEDLHEAAWPIAAEHFAKAKHAAIERFGNLHGTGLASGDAETIQSAADQGRVETLFVSREPSCWGPDDDGRPAVIRLGADQGLAECELLDLSVLATLTSGGKVYQVDGPSPLDGRLMAATFRY